MFLEQVSAIVIIIGSVFYFAAMPVAPQVYQEADIGRRVAILAANGKRWLVSQGLFALGMLVPAAGFSLLTLSSRALPPGWLIFLGAAAFLIGAINGAYLICRQTLDPAAFWENTLPIPNIIGYLYIILSLLALIIYGIAFILGSYPDWIGYLMSGAGAIMLTAFLVLRGEGGFFISVLIYLVTLTAGIVITVQ
jgi:hypothetical protein